MILIESREMGRANVWADRFDRPTITRVSLVFDRVHSGGLVVGYLQKMKVATSAIASALLASDMAEQSKECDLT